MRPLKILLSALLIFTVTISLKAQPLSDRAKITLLTCGSGDELYSVFGHTAIRVNDPQTGTDIVYNFGTFDFSTRNFYLKFVKGDLQYYVSLGSYRDFIYQYKYFDRDVFEQELNLTQAQKQYVNEELNSILLSDRKFYTYKFIDRNCTTMVEDIINNTLPEKISNKNSDNGLTNREIIYSYLKDNHFYENLGIHLMFGAKTDTKPDKPFLPKQLMEGVAASKNGALPLAKNTETVYTRQQEPASPWWNSVYTFTAAVIVLAFFTRNKIVMQTYIAIAGLLGIFFLTVGFYSFHSEITLNYNALLLNPIFSVMLVLQITRKPKALRIVTFTCAACHVVYLAIMLNKPHFAIIIPLLFLHAVIFWRLLRAKLTSKTKSDAVLQ
ncbi:MAG: DUF4105 domain-containing protein [Flavobacterium sp.]